MDYSKFSEETLSRISENEPLDYSKLSDDELSEITKNDTSNQQAASNPISMEQNAPKSISQLESGIRGAADYSSFGFADELEAMYDSGKLSGEEYETRRNQLRDTYKQAADQNPMTYHGAGIASGFALPIGGLGGFATKGASVGAKIAKSALTGAGMGALAGAGTSEATDTTDLLKDIAIGGVAGGALGPALEGGVASVGHVGKMAYDNIGALKAVLDTGKFAAKGSRIVGEEGGRITTENALKSSEDVIKAIKGVQTVKNENFRSAELASNVTIDVNKIQELIDLSIKNGADVKEVKGLQSLLNKLSGKVDEVVTDPAKYNERVRKEISQAQEELKIKTYEKLDKDIQKRAVVAEREAKQVAEISNRKLIESAVSGLGAPPGISGKAKQDFEQTAIEMLKKQGQYLDPIEASKKAKADILSQAADLYKGPSIKTSPVTKTNYVESQIGKDVAVRTKAPPKGSDLEDVADAMVGNASSAGINIQKLADTNSAQAYTIAERENKKAIAKLTKQYDEQQLARSRDDIISELKDSPAWTDPITAAKNAKAATLAGDLNRPLIETITEFSPELNRQVSSSRVGEETVLKKILPNYEFKETKFTKDKLRPEDLNLLKQQASKSRGPLFGAPSDAVGELSSEINKLYKSSIDSSKVDDIDKNLREALAKLNMSGMASKHKLSPNDMEHFTDRLLKKTGRAGADRGSVEFKKTEDAFDKLMQALPEGSPEQLKLKEKVSKLKEDAYKTFLSGITRGHNTFAINPGNLNWTMTAAGKLGYGAEIVGATYRGIVNSPPGKLIGLANDLRQKGFQKYAETLSKIAGTEDVSKRRALTFTLLQNPEFRKLMSSDISDLEND